METEKVKYNKNKPQVVKFRKEDDEFSYLLEFGIDKLEDDDLAEIDRLSQVKFQDLDDVQKITIDDLEAGVWFFDKCVNLLSGFDGDELPLNWKDEFTPVEKQDIARSFLTVESWGSGKSKISKGLSFGNRKTKKVLIKTIFNGVEILCGHELPQGFEKFTGKFRDTTSGLESKKGGDESFLPSTTLKLAELYDEMKVIFSTDDYDEEPPIHHKATVIRDAFGKQTHLQIKKLKV